MTSNYRANFYILLVMSFLATSCQLGAVDESSGKTHVELVDTKYSLTKDREELDKLRESLPPEVKKQNDEKALMAEWMGELRHPPEVVRDKFSNLVRKKRELFNKDMTRLREEYSKNEKRAREEFLKNAVEEREDFLKRKVSREKRAEFFNDQDEVRRTYFAEQREKRDEFESDVREKRKNFDDYIKEKTADINAELKDYNMRWREKIEKENLQKENQQ
ncbi:MAG: hypothetical protein AABY53_02565 [Bdellovibrionota bacterium]